MLIGTKNSDKGRGRLEQKETSRKVEKGVVFAGSTIERILAVSRTVLKQ